MPLNAQPHQSPPPRFDYHTGVAQLADFRFGNGTVLQEVLIEYATVGTPCRDSEGTITNAFLFCHGAYSNYRSLDMWSDIVGPGKPIDTDRYYIVCPTVLGWPGSSAPSNTGLGPAFPPYTTTDIVNSQYRLLTEHLGITRLVCVAGPSLGAALTLRWVTDYPDFMDAAISVAAGARNTGKGYAIFHLANEIIALDPAYQAGNYALQPYRGLECYWSYFFLFLFSYAYYGKKYPTPEVFESKIEERKANAHAFDANDVILFHDARRNVSLEGKLPMVRARCLFIGFYEDEFCPPADNGAISLGKLTPGSTVRVYHSIFGHIGAVFDIRQAETDIRDFLDQRAVILFVESRTGGMARFCAALFNLIAARNGLNMRAEHRAFIAGEDAGATFPEEAANILRAAGSPEPEDCPVGCRLVEGDLFRAGRIISLDDGRQRDFLELAFPEWTARVEFWEIAPETDYQDLAREVAELASPSSPA